MTIAWSRAGPGPRRTVPADLVLLATESTGLAERAGLTIRDGRICIDSSMRTAVEGIYAAGQASQWGSVPGFWSQIGDRWLQYSGWGDGYDEARTVEHGDDSFTVRYAKDRRLVGVLTCAADEDYERCTAMIASGASSPL